MSRQTTPVKLVFSKELVKDSQGGAKRSALAELLSESSRSKESTPRRAVEETPDRKQYVEDLARKSALPSPVDGKPSVAIVFNCKVFLPSGSSVNVVFTKECSLASLLETLFHHTDLPHEQAQDSVMQQLELRVATENGEIDEDFPALDVTRAVHQFGVHTFVLRPKDESSTVFAECHFVHEELLVGPKPQGRLADSRVRLFLAAETGDVQTLAELLDNAPIDINATTKDGWTPLHFAARDGHLPVVSYILKHTEEANIDAADTNGWTPLHVACLQGHYDVAETLLTAGADTTIETNKQETAASLAEQSGNRDMVDLINEFIE